MQTQMKMGVPPAVRNVYSFSYIRREMRKFKVVLESYWPQDRARSVGCIDVHSR